MRPEREDDIADDVDTHSAEDGAIDGDHCPFCAALNQPGLLITCEHHVGWYWDGSFVDLSAELERLKEAWGRFCDVRWEQDEANHFHAFVRSQVQEDPDRQVLFDLTGDETGFLTVLERRAGVELGRGWQTDGMLGGSGWNFYLADGAQLRLALEGYRDLLRKAEDLPQTEVRDDG